MHKDFPADYSHNSTQYLLGYLLEELTFATIDENGQPDDDTKHEIIPALARVAVFDFHARYNSGDRHLLASYDYQWQRVGQIVVANVWEDTDAPTGSPVVARKAGDLSLLVWLGCDPTALNIGEIIT